MMGYAGGNNPIIKSNPVGWMILLVAVLAVGAVILLMLGFFAGPAEDRPDWAPVGCTVTHNRVNGNAVTILVHDLEYFDTEQELGAVIITALEQEADFFALRGRHYSIVDREVNIQFPETRDGRIPILQYTSWTMDRVRVHQLRLVRVADDERMDYYERVQYTEIVEIAEGERELGFLDWMPEAYGREAGE